jgi:hypothetical protein
LLGGVSHEKARELLKAFTMEGIAKNILARRSSPTAIKTR